MEEDCGFRAAKVLGAAAEQFLRDEVAGLSGEVRHGLRAGGSPGRTVEAFPPETPAPLKESSDPEGSAALPLAFAVPSDQRVKSILSAS